MARVKSLNSQNLGTLGSNSTIPSCVAPSLVLKQKVLGARSRMEKKTKSGPKIAELVGKTVTLLEPLESDERQKVIKAVLTILGESSISPTGNGGGGAHTFGEAGHKPSGSEVSSGDVSDLIQKHGDGKPHQNINLLAAIWFSEFGSSPFSLEYLRQKAESTGLTIPASPRMTLVQAKDGGKKLYSPSGRGLFKPTVVGEAFFKATYSVRKGTKAPPPEK